MNPEEAHRNTMGRISIDHVAAGMVLAKDAYTFRKQLLLTAGTVLTDTHIESMRAWGVPEIETEGCAEPTLEEVEARLAQVLHLQSAGEEIDRRFADVRTDPIMHEILAIAKKQLLERA